VISQTSDVLRRLYFRLNPAQRAVPSPGKLKSLQEITYNPDVITLKRPTRCLGVACIDVTHGLKIDEMRSEDIKER